MAFSRGQTQVLYHFLPGAVFEHDRYGFCHVTSVEIHETQINRNALFATIADHLMQWHEDAMRPGFPDPRNENARRNYVVGRPTSVRFKPFPTILECRHCHRVWSLQHLVSRAGGQPRHCPNCNSLLGQLRYVQAHNCGRLEELYFPQGCRTHGRNHLVFHDTGRVHSARWRCGACGGAELGRLRMTPCNCAYSRNVADNPYERGLKTLVLTDSALFLPHVVPFINFDEEQERQLYGDEDTRLLVLARTWGILNQSVSQTLQDRATHQDQTDASANSDAITRDLVNALAQTNPDHPLIAQYRRQQEANRPVPGEDAIDTVRRLTGMHGDSVTVMPSRQQVEHVAILDTLETIEIPHICEWMRSRNDEEGVQRLYTAERFACQQLGFRDLRVISNFPIALCALGYTRITRAPQRSMIRPFETEDPQSRTPLYVVEAETEGIYFQLNPIRVISWLVENEWAAVALPATEAEAWAWLYQSVPGLRQTRWEAEFNDALAVGIRALVHTISHVLLRHVEWSGFNQTSVGEYLLPSALACVLYANRYAETKIGGLTTLFEQRLGLWLSDSVQSGRDCVYDPFCTDDGGSCAGCLHREFNCPTFNHELSRAVLYGGPVPQADSPGGLEIDAVRSGFWEAVALPDIA